MQHLQFIKTKIFISLPLLLAIGCSTVNSRINENPTQFSEAHPQAQMQIQSGNIDKGFTEDMVYMAKGKPDDKTTIKRAGKTIVVWKYAHASITPAIGHYQQGSLNAPYGYPTIGPNPSASTPMLYGHSYFIVEFLKGKVISWKDE